MRKTLLFVVAVFTMILSFEVSAQQRVITGTVISEEDGLGLPGATVLVKGTTVGTTTDLDGNYSISVPAGSDVLIFSFVGLKASEVSIGSRSVVNVTLTVDAAQLSEVVVTAIGIEREKKALGYAVTSVDNAQLENRPESDVARVLQGKVPGVSITSTNGMSGSGTNMVIRGYSSATGSNQPLFVVDGVPFNTSTNAQNGFTGGGATTSSRFLDIDPNNIESMSVLKGLSATVLYGDQGRNGVILITTKSGATKRKAAEVTINQSVFTNEAASLPTYGQEYGNGFQQAPGFFFSNFGPSMNTGLQINHPYATSSVASVREAFPQFWVDGKVGGTPVKYDYKAYKDPSQIFFRKGLISNTSVQVAGGSEKTGFNASFGYTDEEGFTPGNELKKFNFGLGVNSQISDKLSLKSSFTFAITDLDSPPANASYGSGSDIPSVFGHVLFTPRSVDLENLPYENPVDKSSVYFRGGNDITNPNWLVRYYKNTSDVKRFFNSTSLNYDFNDDFSVTYRLGLDTYSELQEILYNKGGATANLATKNGYYRTININNTIWNQDLIVNWKKEFSDKFSMSALLGGNTRFDSYMQTGVASQGQLAFGLFRHSNFSTSSSNDAYSGGSMNNGVDERRYGVYSNITFDYSDYLFLNLSARNDWTSTVEAENRSILYPSANVSFIPTEAFTFLQNKKNINYLKLSGSYATSARFPGPYRTRAALDLSTRRFQTVAGTILNSNSISNFLPNSALKAELLKEAEFGIESKLFQSRLSLDVHYYNRTAQDQILTSLLDPSTGFTAQQINAGDVNNKGFEVQIAYKIIRNKDWLWEVTANWTRNRSMVSNIPTELKEINYAGYSSPGNYAINGMPMGVIKAYGFKRDANGVRIVNSGGDYIYTDDLVIVGDPNANYQLTGISSLTYKGFSFRMQINYTDGGDIYSGTTRSLLARGVTKDTEFDRAAPYILPGVKEDGSVNNQQVSATQAYFNNMFGPDESGMFDATVVRISDMSLSYALPEKMLSKTPFGSLTVSANGSNLWYYAPNFPKYVNFDPEVSSLGVSSGKGLEFINGPSARRMGVSLRVTF